MLVDAMLGARRQTPLTITGKVFGERPYGWVKILLAVFAVFFVFLMMVVFGGD